MQNKIYPLICMLMVLLLGGPSILMGQTTLLEESFETDGNGTRYTTSTLEFTDGSGDYFLRTDGSDISGAVDATGPDGTFFFAAQDIDGEGASIPQSLLIAGIDITGFSGLTFSGLFAEDDASDGNEDWDNSDSVIVEASIDGGAFTTILKFAGDGSTFNSEPGVDSDFDGIRDGAALVDTFKTFSAAIAGTGSSLSLRITFYLNSGDEDILLDLLKVEGTAGTPTPTPGSFLFCENFETDGNGTRYTTTTPEFSDGSGDYFLRTDGSDISGAVDATGPDSSFFFAAQDIDGEGASIPQSLVVTGIDIAGFTDLTFSGLFAEDDASDGNEDWDNSDSVIVEASIDGGAFTTILKFAGDGSTFNSEPGVDSDFDGIRDGAALVDTFKTFSAAIAGTGSSLSLRITFYLNSGDEDILLDLLKVEGTESTPAPDPVVLCESFETDGNGSRYTTSVDEFTDNFGDYFLRTDGSDIGGFVEVSGQDSSFFFAAQDLNGEGGPTTVTLDIQGVDISGRTDLSFAGLFAEDQSSDGNEDWDADALVFVEVSIDGGAFTKILQFASAGATNTEPGVDADFDGVRDGVALSPTFQNFTAPIAGTGSTLDLRITIENLEAGDEDIAFDNIKILEGVTPPTCQVQIDEVTVMDESVANAADGSIEVTASGASSIVYSIDGGATFGTASLFENLGPDTYIVVVADLSIPGCSAADTVTVEAGEAPVITGEVLFCESFETDGNSLRYSTSIPEFSDGSGDYFTRTDGSDISGAVQLAGADSSFFFAAQDIDGEGASVPQSLLIENIDVDGFSALSFSALFAEDDASDGNEDWDDSDLVFVEASIDGGAFTKILQFAGDGSQFNSEPGVDSDFDGIRDGDALTSDFAAFTADIAGTGASLSLKITFFLNSGDEDIAVDQIKVFGIEAASPTVLCENFETDGNGTRYTTSTPEFSDGSGDYFTRTDGGNIGGFVNVSGQDSSFFFGAQDIDGEGATIPQTLSFTGLNIAGLTDLVFSGLFAEDESSDGAEDWDVTDLVFVEASIDGAPFAKILQFAGDSSTFNSEPGLDADFDGKRDGAALTPTFTTFTADIAGTGTTLDLRITFFLNAGDEDIAIDLIKVQGVDASADPDTTAPLAVCVPTLDVFLDETGAGALTAVELDGGSADNLTPENLLTFSIDQETFGCGDVSLSPITVTLTVTDQASLSATCTTAVTVRDTIAPSLSVTSQTVELDASGQFTPNPFGDGLIRSFDDVCGILSVNLGPVDPTITVLTCEDAKPDDAVDASGLFFSEYVEGSSNNKYLEIFNGTGDMVNLSDYQLFRYNNGSTTSSFNVVLSGELGNGDVFVIANPDATLTQDVDLESPITFFNGNDVIAMVQISTGMTIDQIGVIGEDSFYNDNGVSTGEQTLRRKANVTHGIVPTAGFPELDEQWDSFPQDTGDGLGEHTIDGFYEGVPYFVEITDNSGNVTRKEVSYFVLDPLGACDFVCDIDAGKIAPLNKDLSRQYYTSVEDTFSLPAVITQAPVVPNGFEVIYVVSQGRNKLIRKYSPVAVYDTTKDQSSIFTIHTLVYESDPNSDNFLDLSQFPIGNSFISDIEALISNTGVCAAINNGKDAAQFIIKPCRTDAGTLTADVDNVSMISGSATISATPDGNLRKGNAFSILYVLTKTDDLTIMQVSETPSFTVTEPGKYRIHTLIYSASPTDEDFLDLSVVVPGTTTGGDVAAIIADQKLCADLDVAGAVIMVTNGGTPRFSFTDLSIQPNPTTAKVVITAPGAEAMAYELTDLNGRRIMAGEWNFSGTGQQQISLEKLVSGVYQLSLQDLKTGEVYHEKLIKQ